MFLFLYLSVCWTVVIDIVCFVLFAVCLFFTVCCLCLLYYACVCHSVNKRLLTYLLTYLFTYVQCFTEIMGRNSLYADNDDRLLSQTRVVTTAAVQWTSPRIDSGILWEMSELITQEWIAVGSSNLVVGLTTRPAMYDHWQRSRGQRSRPQGRLTYQQQ